MGKKTIEILEQDTFSLTSFFNCVSKSTFLYQELIPQIKKKLFLTKND